MWLGLSALLAAPLCLACSDPSAPRPVEPDAGEADEGEADAGESQEDGGVDGEGEDGGSASDGGTEPDAPDEGPRFRVVDLAILYPRPTSADQLLAMQFELDGKAHTLLPEHDFEALRQGDGVLPLFAPTLQDDVYDSLRVTALRADPCADQLAPDAATECVRQVRLVAQYPHAIEGDAQVIFSDASLHLFFEPDDARFVTLLEALHGLGKSLPGNPALTVHPTLAKEGLQGEATRALERAIAAACRSEDLRKITILNAGPHGDDWLFEGVTRDQKGKLARFDVAGFDDDSDHSASSFALGLERDTFNGFIDPVPGFPSGFLEPQALASLGASELAKGMEELDRILNPTRVHPNSTPCSACHIAEKLQLAVRSARKDVTLPPSPAAYAAPAQQNVEGTRVLEIGFANLHAFSYFGDEPTILTRVIHEAAASAAFVNSPAFRAGLTPDAQAAWDAAFVDP